MSNIKRSIIQKLPYKEGDLIIYRNGDSYEIGKIKRFVPGGAYVWYNEGETASNTSYECMHPLINAYVVKMTTLGGGNDASTP